MAQKVVCQNKKATHDFFIEERMEAGMVLLGPEVKSLRDGRASLNDSHARLKGGELFIYKMHITPYPFASAHMQLDPLRPRKLLLKRREIRRLIGKIEERGYALIPTRIYFNEKGRAKVELALARGKKKYDKRQALKEKDQKREMDQARKRGGH